MKTRTQLIEEFINKYKDLPKQGSKEWLDQRKFTVGGSQIATLMGINKYENMKSFAKSKCNFYSFKKEAPLWFGTLLEPAVEKYVEIEFNTKTVETGSLPCDFNKYLSYSPDGICVIKKNKLESVLTKEDINNCLLNSDVAKCVKDEEDIIVLMEFKCPFMRKIIKGDIPKYYKPQPLLGMEIIKIAEVSVFIECVFRFCSFKDLYTNKYSYYHYDKERLNGQAIMYSAISLYYEKDNTDEELKDIILSLDNYKNTQYGWSYKEGDISSISDRKIINKIMENIVDKKNIKIVYHNMYSNRKKDYDGYDHFKFNYYNNPLKFVGEMKAVRNNIESDGKYNFMGCMFYKMLDINQIPIMKENILTEGLINKIKNTFDKIEEMNKIEEEINVMAFIKKNF